MGVFNIGLVFDSRTFNHIIETSEQGLVVLKKCFSPSED